MHECTHACTRVHTHTHTHTHSRILLICSRNLSFTHHLQNFFQVPSIPLCLQCTVYLNFTFLIYQTSRNLYLYSAYRGNIFDIKWHLLRDCLYLHVFSRTTIAIRWSVIQLKQICILLYTTKNGIYSLKITTNKI
jgi:hypothetical protein